MAEASNYLENALLDHALCGDTAYTMPSTWIALFTDSASTGELEAGTLTNECAYTSYARVSTSGSDWNAASSGSIDNANAFTFPQATGGSETAGYFAIMDASTAGNVLAYSALDSNLAISTGITPKFSAAALVVTCNGSDFIANKTLDMLVGKTDWAEVTNLYVALYTGAPSGGDITTSEATFGSYARQTTSAATWSAASGGTKSNGAAITFPEATSGSDTITHFGIVSSTSGAGDLWFSGALTSSVVVSTNVTAEFAVGNLDITLD